MARTLGTEIGRIRHRSSVRECKVGKTKSVPKVGWRLIFGVRDFVVRRHLALETGSTRMRINEASHFLLHLFADPIHSQNRQVQVRVGRLRRGVATGRSVITGGSGLQWDILCVGVGRVIVDTLALKFLTPVAGLIAAASDLAYLA
jgi:hypothetical protein